MEYYLVSKGKIVSQFFDNYTEAKERFNYFNGQVSLWQMNTATNEETEIENKG